MPRNPALPGFGPTALVALGLLGLVGCGTGSDDPSIPDGIPAAKVDTLPELSIETPAPGTASTAAPQGAGPAVEDRKLQQIEKRLNALETELADLRPMIQRLSLVEYDIRVLVDKMEAVTFQQAASGGAANQPQTGLGATGLSPAPLVPLGPVPVGAPPDAATPAPTDTTPAPLTIAAPRTGPAPQASGGFGLHLASYKRESNLAKGWEILRKRYPGQLTGLDHVAKSANLGGGKGTVWRLVSGPVADRSTALELCGALDRAGQYCRVVTF